MQIGFTLEVFGGFDQG